MSLSLYDLKDTPLKSENKHFYISANSFLILPYMDSETHPYSHPCSQITDTQTRPHFHIWLTSNMPTFPYLPPSDTPTFNFSIRTSSGHLLRQTQHVATPIFPNMDQKTISVICTQTFITLQQILPLFNEHTSVVQCLKIHIRKTRRNKIH